MASPEEQINFSQLEQELQGVIDSDVRYWQQNDAKFRAVNQQVPTYEDFRQMVLAAHLKPLEKQDRMEMRPKSVWNSFANRRKQNATTTTTQSSDAANMNVTQVDNYKVPTTTHDFTRQWRQQTDNKERFLFLRRLGQAHVASLVCSGELGFGLLGELIRALLCGVTMSTTGNDTQQTDYIVFSVRLLESLTSARRFGLTLQFLSAAEKNDCQALFGRLRHELREDLQDLAERGVTEWTLQELAKKYDVIL